MENKNTKFLQGAIAGLALGIAASLFMNSKTGKKMKKEVNDMLADFYASIAPRLKKIGKIGKEEYQEFMEQAIDQYAKAKKLSAKMVDQLREEIQHSWKVFSKHAE